MRYLIGFLAMLGSVVVNAQDCELCDDVAEMLSAQVAAESTLPSAAMYIYKPSADIAQGLAVGSVRMEGGDKLTYKHPFRIASVTKPFVAATILRLHEQNKLDIQDAIHGYLNDELLSLLASGGYDTKQITISHLLTHTSGLFDVFLTEAFVSYFENAAASAQWKLLTLEEQVRLAVEHPERYGEPGETFHYSDTGYILLGAIIENLTAQNMAVAVREQLSFERLGLHNTWWEVFERAPADALPRAHQYLGDMDSNTIEPIFDLYGGGGLISNTEDLAKFFYHLLKGELFEKESTLGLLLAIPAVTQAKTATLESSTDGIVSMYGHGVSTHTYETAKIYSHGGFWGVLAGYSPDIDTSFAISLQQQELADKPIKEIIRTVLVDAHAGHQRTE